METWWNQDYLPEEDVSFRALVADYQKVSGNKSTTASSRTPPLRQKEIAAIQSGSGGVFDLTGVADIRFTPLNAWDDHRSTSTTSSTPGSQVKLCPTALGCCDHDNKHDEEPAH